MAGRSEVRGNAAESGQESLRCNGSAEPFHRPFALPGGLVGVLGSIVQIFVLPMLDRRHGGAVSDLVTKEFVGDQRTRRQPCFFSSFLKNLVAAVPFRFDWMRMSRTLPSWSTVHHKYFRTPPILTKTSSRCHLSPAFG